MNRFEVEPGEQRREKEERVIQGLLERVGRLSIAAQELETREGIPNDTKYLIQDICVALQTLLEERRDFLHPEMHPKTTIAGTQYRHRDEAIAHLNGVIKRLEKRDMRTIEIQPEPEATKKHPPAQLPRKEIRE